METEEKKMGKKLSLLRSGFLVSILIIVAGIFCFTEFLTKGYWIGLAMSVQLLAVGVLLLMIVILATRDYFEELKTEKEKAEKAENKLYEKDDWVSYGGGLHQYRPHK
ncbi:MAG: hypothetical protein Q7S81_03080 [bacterium]|nr:hypothetical protein [bacterium]